MSYKNNTKTFILFQRLRAVFLSNFISLSVSLLTVAIIPKFLSIENYGYWQLYLFYVSYVGFLHFGWNDGIYLRYGGVEYDNLDKDTFYSQFILLSLFQTLIAVIVVVITMVYNPGLDRSFIFNSIALSIVLLNLRTFILFVFQGSGKIKEYSRIVISERIIFIVIVLIGLMLRIDSYKLIVISDLVGKFVSFLFSVYLGSAIVIQPLSRFSFDLNEVSQNIRVGIKLLISNISSMLIIGIVRFSIENVWDISMFGKISLTLSVSNMFIIFINAVGIILYPMLRQTNSRNHALIYTILRRVLSLVMYAILITYYPLKSLLFGWLPQFGDSLIFMAILFPVFIFEGKMALIVNTLYNTLREEAIMLKINIVSMLFSIVISYVAAVFFRNLALVSLGIVVVLFMRSSLAEIYITKKIGLSVYKELIFDLLLIVIFIATGWYIDSILATLIYTLSFAIYILVFRKDFIRSTSDLKAFLRH